MSLPYHRGSTANNNSNMYRNSGNGSGRNKAAEEANITLMELENNQRWNELGDQAALLKEVCQDINREVKDQNRLLDSMGKGFVSTSELFTSTLGKLNTMLSQPGSHHMYYLVGFVVFVFLLLYFLMGRSS